MSESEAQRLGKLRKDAHPHGTRRLYDDPTLEDRIGVAGELAFAERYGLEVDKEARPEGDGHVDFWLKINGMNVSIDVKTARKPNWLLCKEWEIKKASDIFVLAHYKSDDDVDIIGWDTRFVMSLMEVQNWKPLNINVYPRHVSQLRPVSQLDKLIWSTSPLGGSAFL